MNKKSKNSYETENFWDYSAKQETPVTEAKREEIKAEVKQPKVEQPKVEQPKVEQKKTFSEYKVRVNYSSLKIRTAPSSEGNVIGYAKNSDVYTILSEENGFGKIDEGKWIMLSYCIKL